MTTATPQKVPSQETWVDWLAPGQKEPADLITREQLVAEVEALGFKVSANDLRYANQADRGPHLRRGRQANHLRR